MTPALTTVPGFGRIATCVDGSRWLVTRCADGGREYWLAAPLNELGGVDLDRRVGANRQLATLEALLAVLAARRAA